MKKTGGRKSRDTLPLKKKNLLDFQQRIFPYFVAKGKISIRFHKRIFPYFVAKGENIRFAPSKESFLSVRKNIRPANNTKHTKITNQDSGSVTKTRGQDKNRTLEFIDR